MAGLPIGRRLALFALPLAVLVATAAVRQGRAPAVVTVQLLAINDFHGNLEPGTGANGLIGRTPAELHALLQEGIAQSSNEPTVRIISESRDAIHHGNDWHGQRSESSHQRVVIFL